MQLYFVLNVKVDDVKTEAAHRHFLLKDQIAQKEKIIKQDKEKSKVDMVKNLQRKNVSLMCLQVNDPSTINIVCRKS